jgi:hypothetical protein
MSTMDDLFTDYIKSIMPYDRAVNRAITAHRQLRDDLEADEVLGPHIERTLLSGSYGRDTAIHGIKDVDVIVQLTLTISDIQSLKRANETEQACLLRITREAIERTGRAANTKSARRSIYVELPEEVNQVGEDLPALTLDIVPVLIPSDKDQDPMTIADRESKQWFDTYPNSQLNDSVERNQESTQINGYRSYKSLVKMMKSWKKVHFHLNKTPKGFILECLVARFHNRQADHWIDAVHDLLQNISNQWPSPDLLDHVPEIHDISNENWQTIPIAKDVEDAKRVLKKLQWSLTKVTEAKDLADSDLYEAAKILQQVFGADETIGLCFPLPEKDDKAKNQVESIKERGSQHNIQEAYPFG